MTTFKQTAFQLKGSLFTLTILQLQNPDPEAFTAQLKQSIEQAPKFFLNAPIVLDLQMIDDESVIIDFEAMKTALVTHQLIPIAICGGNKNQQKQALTAGLAVLPTSRPEPSSIAPKVKAKTNTAEPTSFVKAKLIQQPVRSGQQIYAKDTDLIIMSSVSPGAEVLADGNIHVYGTLRGRALAGINGNKDARIFCHRLEAELVSIAGLYQLSDDLKQPSLDRHVQIMLANDRLSISSVE